MQAATINTINVAHDGRELELVGIQRGIDNVCLKHMHLCQHIKTG